MVGIRLLFLLCIFALSSYGMYIIYSHFPTLQREEIEKLALPTISSEVLTSVKNVYIWIKDIENVKKLGVVLSTYSQNYYYEIISAYVAAYIFLQSFAIPGSASLSLLGGALFGFNTGMFLVCLCSSIGATNCYLISWIVGSPFVEKMKGTSRMKYLEDQVKAQKSHLLSYLLFLRATPLLPNWFINITSPHVGIPLTTFFIGTFLGVIPLSVIPVNAGLALQTLTSFDDFSIWKPKTLAIIFATAFCALIPTIVMKSFGSKFEAEKQKKTQ